MTLIAASLLSADFAELKNEIRSVEQGGADWLHLDVMDGHFVPNITFGPFIARAIRKITNLPLDAHLMITDPLKYAPEFARAGADYITIHAEVIEDLKYAIDQIKKLKVKAGLSVNPETPMDKVLAVIGEIDLFLVMSVHPGFGGQKFMPEVLDKVRTLKKLKDQGKTQALISIDGGINPETSRQALSAGAEVLVAGAAIFGVPDRAAQIEALRGEKPTIGIIDIPFTNYRNNGKRLLGKPSQNISNCRHGYGLAIIKEGTKKNVNCVYCDKRLTDTYDSWLNLSIDHVIPKSVGWYKERNDWVEDIINMVICCRACNEFLNKYKVTEAKPENIEEFIKLRDEVFYDKKQMAQGKHKKENDYYRRTKNELF